jgi:hypothetical protein
MAKRLIEMLRNLKELKQMLGVADFDFRGRRNKFFF